MMDMNFMLIIDIVILALGGYLAVSGIRYYKQGEVDNMLITADERAKCSDIKGLSKYLMPKSVIFGVFCVFFGIQGLLSDSQRIDFPKAVNAAFLVAFVIVWILFSYVIRKAKKTYIH